MLFFLKLNSHTNLKVCGGIALDLFEPNELELLICGNPFLDFKQLKNGTSYEDGNSNIILPTTTTSSTGGGEKKVKLDFNPEYIL